MGIFEGAEVLGRNCREQVAAFIPCVWSPNNRDVHRGEWGLNSLFWMACVDSERA